jgi:hypothetical protein
MIFPPGALKHDFSETWPYDVHLALSCQVTPVSFREASALPDHLSGRWIVIPGDYFFWLPVFCD